MDISLLQYFLVGALVCFIGTLPFGPINLSVVKTTVDKNHLRGFEVALAASIVEIIQALVALWFGMVISSFLEANVLFRVLVASTFIVIGIMVWARKPSKDIQAGNSPDASEFKTGLLIAAVNPQAIPFWIFALAVINQYITFHYDGTFLVAFLAGVFAGKLLALSVFVLLSHYLKIHLRQSGRIVNRLLAFVLLLIGVGQLGEIFLA